MKVVAGEGCGIQDRSDPGVRVTMPGDMREGGTPVLPRFWPETIYAQVEWGGHEQASASWDGDVRNRVSRHCILHHVAPIYRVAAPVGMG